MRCRALYSYPSGAGRSLRSIVRPRARGRATLRAWRRAGAVALAGPLRGPVPFTSRTPVDAAAAAVYRVCMSRTNVDIDDDACAEVMRRYRLATKREAVNYALRALAAEPLGVDDARRLRGTGWEGDLEEMRSGRAS